MELLITQVEQWAVDKGLHTSDPAKQLLKIVEELGEVSDAFLRGDMESLIDGLGDLQVTIIIFHLQQKLNPTMTLEAAYNVIRNRNGKLLNGTFIKEEEL